MTAKLLKSLGLIAGTILALVIGFPGIQVCLLAWVVLSVLFLVSRFSKRARFFTDWSWPLFLVTIGSALGIPYVFLVLSAGF